MKRKIDVAQDIDLIKAGLGVSGKQNIDFNAMGIDDPYMVNELLMNKGIYNVHKTDCNVHEIIIDMIIAAMYMSGKCSKKFLLENYLTDKVYVFDSQDQMTKHVLSRFKPREDEVPEEFVDQLDLEDFVDGNMYIYDVRTKTPHDVISRSITDGDYSEIFQSFLNEILFCDELPEEYFCVTAAD